MATRNNRNQTALRAEDALRPRGEKGKKQAGREFGRVAREEKLKRVLEPRRLDAGERKALNEKLLDACKKGDADEVETLLERGASVHAKDDEGMTGLLVAAFHRHEDVARVLLAKGARVNATDDDDQDFAQKLEGFYEEFTRLSNEADELRASVDAASIAPPGAEVSMCATYLRYDRGRGQLPSPCRKAGTAVRRAV